MEKPIKVLHIMPQIAMAGAELQLRSLVLNSSPELIRHRVLYYEVSDPVALQEYVRSGIHLDYVPRNRKNPLGFIRRLSKAIAAQSPDIVHCWLYSGCIWGRWAALHAGAEHILVAYRNSFLSKPRIMRFLERFTTHRVTYLANSRAVANGVGKILGVDPEKFHVVYNGLSLEKFGDSAVPADLRRELSIPDGMFIATMVGRLTYQKNYEMLLRVVKLCNHKKLPIYFCIVGKGDMEKELKEMAKKLKIQDRVSFLGVRPDIPQILNATDIFCFTTRFEGFPNVLLEAMASGLPVVTTNFDGVDELITNGQDALYVDIDDHEKFTELLEQLLLDPDMSSQIASNAVQTVQSRFSDDAMVQHTYSVYRQILHRE